MSLIKGQGAGEVSTGFYKHLLDQSLKFNDDDAQYLTRTPASAGNRKTWTWSGWVKRSNISIYSGLMGAGGSGIEDGLRFDNTDIIRAYLYNGGYVSQYTTARKFRDVSAFYHIVWAFDSTNSTESERSIIYVNGVRQTLTQVNATTLNGESGINNNSGQVVGAYGDASSNTFDGYIAEVNFVDGTQLTADSFGETKDGIWIPKDTSGLTFGTNGFHLTFKDDVVSEGFNTVTYTGTGATQSISGVGFSPSLAWIKGRSTDQHHNLFDVLRSDSDGPRRLYSSLNAAEESTVYSGTTNVSSLDADGFTMGNGTSVNESGETFVGWCWEAGGTPTADNSAGAGATPTAGSVKIDGSNLGSALGGSIAATRLSADTSKGFSIVTYTGNYTAGATVAHGLDSVGAPKWILIKKRGGADDWFVYHDALGATKGINLNTTNAAFTGTVYNDTAPTSSVFSLGQSNGVNENSQTFVAYCWAEISGYSAFGTYSGTGSSGNAITGLGFKPAFLMIKRTDSAGSWRIYDNTRDVVDPRNLLLFPSDSSAEATSSTYDLDFDSDGFTLDGTNAASNNSGGTYIWMAFGDSREAAFFKDVSSNGNHFTPVNLDYRDSVPDVPTNNFAVLNALDLASGFSLSEGNLQIATTTSGARSSFGNFIPASGKWYFEANVKVISAIASWANFGVAPEASLPSTDPQSSSGGISFQDSGRLFVNGSSTTDWVPDWAVGDILQCAFDADTGKVWLGKNNTYGGSGNPASSSNEAGTITGKIKPLFGQNSGDNRSTTLVYNFGQDSSFSGAKSTANSNADGNGHGSFAYAPPSGYLALCSQNLPDVDIIDGSEHFNTVLYTGNGTNGTAITGVNFSPDWLWIKRRSSADNHMMFDSVRVASGVNQRIFPNLTNAEDGNFGSVNSLDSNGFTLGNNVGTNQNSQTFVAWNWLAGTAFSNSAGANGATIASSGQVNATAGFCIVSYTRTSSGSDTIAHGLSAKPEAVLYKSRSSGGWYFTHESVDGSYDFLRLDTTDANSNISGASAPTTTVFSNTIFGSAEDFIAYCFHSVEGYSKVGSYTGNGSTDGPFVYTGHRPSFLLIKRTDANGTNSWIFDNKRSTFNVVNDGIITNGSDAEFADNSSLLIDFLSNGFKMRNTYGDLNTSGANHIFLSLAESPFKFANAR